jgi:tetratricopeptide (TPR) repeat protein
MPNLDVVDAVLRVYNEAYLNNDKQSSFRSAKLNFMKDAITLLYSYGRFSKAEEYYKKLCKEEPGKYRSGFMAFLRKEWAEDIKDASVKEATNIIGGLIYSGLVYMVKGDMEKAVEHENLAKYLYNAYQKANADVKQRIGLAPYKTLKAGMIKNALQTFPPLMAQILSNKIKETKEIKEKEQNISRGIIPGLSY